jgi:phosphate transport system substrate-binding protein
MYVPPKSSKQIVKDFMDFVLSDDGQEVVEKTGFVSLAVRTETPVLPDNAPAEFKNLVNGAERLSLSFRFRPDTLTFDNRSRRDFDRLIHALDRKELQGRKVMLFGFSDESEGTKAKAVSEQWTKLAAGELTARGIRPALEVGMGAVMPVGQSGSKDGTLRNNRVEVWLAKR